MNGDILRHGDCLDVLRPGTPRTHPEQPMNSDIAFTFTVNARPAALAFKRFARALRQAERRINRTGPRPAVGWRHRKGQAHR